MYEKHKQVDEMICLLTIKFLKVRLLDNVLRDGNAC